MIKAVCPLILTIHHGTNSVMHTKDTEKHATVAEQHHIYLGTKVDTEGRRCDFKYFLAIRILS